MPLDLVRVHSCFSDVAESHEDKDDSDPLNLGWGLSYVPNRLPEKAGSVGASPVE